MITTIGIYISYHLLFRLITLDYERRSDIINCQLLILTSQNIFKWETWLNPSQDQKILATCLAGSFDFDKTFLSSFEFWLKKSVIPNQLQFYRFSKLAGEDKTTSSSARNITEQWTRVIHCSFEMFDVRLMTFHVHMQANAKRILYLFQTIVQI